MFAFSKKLGIARAFLCVVGGCAVHASSSSAAPMPRSLYDGAAVMFEQSYLVKPHENTNLGLAAVLAPLIVQEGSSNPIVSSQVYFEPGTVQLNGRAHQQMTYWWFCGSAKSNVVQGVRITLNTNGAPVIYEAITPVGSLSQIFVAQPLETAARTEFAGPLPGRRHAVERSLIDAPRVVVSRVIEEPAVVMGPIIYLAAGTHDVATLICRCMDSQAKSVAGQGFYELVPADFSGKVPAATRPEAAVPHGLPKDFLNQTNRLSRSLRLPAGF